MSQDFLKTNKVNDEVKFNITMKSKYENLLKKKRIDLYFDEIHSGGSTDRSKEILEAFINSGFEIDIFVMVTATFAKPSIIYDNFLETQNPIVLQWSYEDQQLMKEATKGEY